MIAWGLIRTALPICVLALAPAAASAQASRQAVPIARPARAEVQGFSVVLVAGTVPPGAEAAASDVPRGAAKALADMAEFLPYKHYRLLDTAWVLNSGSGRFTSRMRGLETQAFDVILETAEAASRVGVKFELRHTRTSSASDKGVAPVADAVPPDALARREELRKELVTLENQLVQLRRKVGAQHADTIAAVRRYDELVRKNEVATRERLKRGKYLEAPIVDTNFTMDVGETVVVGTSRLQGDTALIVLLTAVPRATK
jgi:hypothetical protein